MIAAPSIRRLALAASLVALAAWPAARGAHADAGAANACAARLPGDARAIFNATLPELRPGTDLRTLVTERTRSLAISGAISREHARDSAVSAADCLRLVES